MSEKFSHGYALLIGVGESAYPKWSLPVTVKDVQALQGILVDPNLCCYPDDKQHIRLLNDAAATRSAILEELTWLKNQAAIDQEATVIVYYSGHGWLDQSTDNYYLIPHDVEPVDIPSSALSSIDFTNALRQINSQRLLVIIDSCHAEGMATTKNNKTAITLPPTFVEAPLPKSLIDELKRGEGRAIFTSSRGYQKSWIRPDSSLSIYTYHLLKALQGAGNQPGEIVVRLSNLMNYLGKAVPESALKLCQAEQVPFFDTACEDFSVALLQGGKGVSISERNNLREQTSDQVSPVVQVYGSGSTATGGAIIDSQVTSGNENVVQQGTYNVNIGKARDVSIGTNNATENSNK